jgi:Family of unknown function (DUF6011)
MQKRSAHTASFLQTFHTGQTTAARREAAGAEGSEPKAAPADAAAVAFVRGRSAKFAAPTPDHAYFAEYRGVKVKHGDGLITEPQAKYVVGIALDREGVTDAMLASLKERLEQGFAKYAASQFITTYKGLPQKSRQATAPAVKTAPASDKVTEDGIYVDRETGRIFKVQFNKGQGTGTRLYAKQLTVGLERNGDYEYHNEGLLSLDLTGVRKLANGKANVDLSWDYVSGLIYRIKPEWRLRPEDAKEWGVLYGSCVRCHRDLTKEESIGRMMGDTCAAKQGF